MKTLEFYLRPEPTRAVNVNPIVVKTFRYGEHWHAKSNEKQETANQSNFFQTTSILNYLICKSL